MKRIVLSAVICLLAMCMIGCNTADESISDNTLETTASLTESLNISSEQKTTSENNTEMMPMSEPSETSGIKSVEITLDYSIGTTHASNQTAIWIEDSNGAIVKTIYISNFTASRRGYRERENALSHWVTLANPDSMGDDEIDAISSATLSTGSHSFSWDLTDESGERVLNGIYTIKIEGTLYWSSNVLFSAQVDMGESVSGELTVSESRTEPETFENADMLSNIHIYAVS